MTREKIAALPADDWRRRSEELREPQLTQHLKLVEWLRLVAARHDTTPGAIAVAWTLRNPAVNRAIVGFRRPEQVDEIVAAANLTLDKHAIATILRRK
jgi:aryl-alcohol dehydrogenase-like predicted oxidoreductase